MSIVKHAYFENKKTGVVWGGAYVQKQLGWNLYSTLLQQERRFISKSNYNKLDDIDINKYVEISSTLEYVNTFIPKPSESEIETSNMVYINTTDFSGVVDKTELVEKINCYNEWIFTNDKSIDTTTINIGNYDADKMKVVCNSEDDPTQYLTDKSIMEDYQFAIDELGDVYTRDEFISKHTCLTINGEKMIINECEYADYLPDINFDKVILLREINKTEEITECFWWNGEEVISTVGGITSFPNYDDIKIEY